MGIHILLSGGFFGFDITEVLLHLLNLTILVVGLNFLLYKPIKNIIENRKKEYEDIENAKNQAAQQVEEYKLEQEKLVKLAKEQEEKMLSNAIVKAEKKRTEIISNAKVEAEHILEKAQKEIKKQKDSLKEELSNAIPDLAVSIASKILQRELTESDNDKIISDIISDWKE